MKKFEFDHDDVEFIIESALEYSDSSQALRSVLMAMQLATKGDTNAVSFLKEILNNYGSVAQRLVQAALTRKIEVRILAFLQTPTNNEIKKMKTKIDRFKGEHEFLSNFYKSRVVYEGKWYPTLEHAYQAAKSVSAAERQIVGDAATPAIAKKLGRSVTIREDWDNVKVSVMTELVEQKFMQNPILGELLLGTGDAELIEGNWWNDKFWGVCRGEGKNMLGIILMNTREKLREKKVNDKLELTRVLFEHPSKPT